jgi:hypothetical protein
MTCQSCIRVYIISNTINNITKIFSIEIVDMIMEHVKNDHWTCHDKYDKENYGW